MKKNGFTLVEVLLYTSLVVTVIIVSSVIFTIIIQSRVKNQVIAEVDHQGLQVIDIISQTIRNSDNINSPAIGLSSSSLSVNSVAPIIFDVSGGVIRVKEGVNPEIALTNNRVIVSNLLFRNTSRSGTDGNVRVSFTITHMNPGGRNEYDYSKNFFISASLRR